MNETSTGEVAGEAFAYLNQTSHSLLPDEILSGYLVNYPYRLALSIVEAIRTHYRDALESSGLLINIQAVLNIVGYFFSSYAVGCFVIALILNRFVLMASLRSNTRTVSLPRWSRYFVHLLAIIPLVYSIIQVLCQLEAISLFPPAEVPIFLARTFLIFAWSHLVETFITTTTNLKPLEESDYTIFELSLQFYFLCQSPHHDSLSLLREHLPDFLVALTGRMLIHCVEMFNLRHYRLLGSTLLNVFSIGHLAYRVKRSGFESLPVFTRIRHFPKVFSLFLILLSVLTYLLACMVRKNPFSSRQYNTAELQFYSFMHNWWNHLNCTGEEEFSNVVSKLALLLCSGTESMEKGIHREFSSLNSPDCIHQSYFVSSYMNCVSSIPEDTKSDAIALNSTTNSSDKFAFLARMKLSIDLIKQGCLFYLKGKYRSKNISKNSKLSKRKSRQKDYNRFITEKNYVKFLTKPSKDIVSDSSEALLPEEDLSEDYIPIEDDYEDIESDIDVTDAGQDTAEGGIDNEVSQLLAPEDVKDLAENMKWFISMWSILSCTTANKRRLTRSLYATLNPESILREVVQQKNFSSYPTAPINDRNSTEDYDSDEQTQLACVVCRINQRNIVLWPCRCFAICEDCRISLGLRGFKSCVCCRSEVHGYSKLNAV